MNLFWIKMKNSFYGGLSELFLNISGLFVFVYIRIYLVIIIIFNTLNWVLARMIKVKSSQDLTILHYNVDFGVNLIDNPKKIYTIPLLGFVIVLINFIIAAVVYKQNDKFLCHILFLAAVLSEIFLLAALASLYLVNYR